MDIAILLFSLQMKARNDYGKQKNFLTVLFGKLILPGIVLQSVLIGGGYATGREIVEYGAKFGAMGWLAGVGTF